VQREKVLAERYERRKKRQEGEKLLGAIAGSSSSKLAQTAAASAKPTRQLRDRARVSDHHKAAALSDIRRKRGKEGPTEEGDLESLSSVSSPSASSSSASESEATEGEESDREMSPRKLRSAMPTATDIAAARAADASMQLASASDEQATIITQLADARRLQLTRMKLEPLANEPWFSEAVRGFFVRVQLGRHEGKPVYRMAVVSGARQGDKLYPLTDGRPTRALLLLHYPGVAADRYMRLMFISNGPISESEFAKFSADCSKAVTDTSLAHLHEIDAMLTRFASLAARPHTEDDVRAMLKEREKQLRERPINIAAEKTAVLFKLQTLREGLAEHPEYEEQIREQKKRLQELLDLEEQETDMETKAAESSSRRPIEISKINQRRRELNYAAQRSMTQTLTQTDAKGDVFARIQTAPTLCLPPMKKAQKDGSDAADKKEDEKSKEDEKKKKQPAQTTEPQQQQQRKVKPPDDTYAKLRELHNFDIAVDLAAISAGKSAPSDQQRPSAAAITCAMALAPPVPEGLPHISFAEYIRHRQLQGI